MSEQELQELIKYLEMKNEEQRKYYYETKSEMEICYANGKMWAYDDAIWEIKRMKGIR